MKENFYLVLRSKGGGRRNWCWLVTSKDRGRGGRSGGDGTWSPRGWGSGGVEGNADGGGCALKRNRKRIYIDS